ncbi:MAG: hypothetical protein U0610_11925 [bacterium]
MSRAPSWRHVWRVTGCGCALWATAAAAAGDQPPPWEIVLDDRTQAVRYALLPDLSLTAGHYRGDEIFFAPFGSLALERDDGRTRWGVAASLFWIDGEPYIDDESRDSALRSFLSAYVTAPLGEPVDSVTPLGPLRLAARYGARIDVEHVFPQLSLGAALGATLAPTTDVALFTHLAPTVRLPDADYSLATTDVTLLAVPEPWLAGDGGLRLGAEDASLATTLRLHGAIGSTTSELGLEIALTTRSGLALGGDLTLTRAYGGTVERRIADAHLAWANLTAVRFLDDHVTITPGARVRVGTDRFGTVEENVLETWLTLELGFGDRARAALGYRIEQGEIENRPARYAFDADEQRFLDSATRVRDSARRMVERLDHALDALASGSPASAAQATELVTRSAGALHDLAAVLDRAAARLEGALPDAARALRRARRSLADAEASLDRLLADPSGARSAAAVARALAPVRDAVADAFGSPIFGDASLDDVITGLTTVPRAFTREMGAAEINDLIRDLAHDDDFGFLLSEVDVLLVTDWKDHTARGLEPVTANDVFRFFANQLADEALDLLRDGLAEIADEYQDHPNAVLARIPKHERVAAKRFLDSLASLRVRDLIDVDALRRMLPSNTLTEDTAITVANLVNGKVLRVRKAMTDFRSRLAVRGGASLDQLLADDLDRDVAPRAPR